MGASQLKDAEFNKVISDYYETGQLSAEIFTHLDQIASYTPSKPNFAGYSSDWREGMAERARDKVINILIARKYEVDKLKPFPYFSRVYYNEFVEYIKQKTREQEFKENYSVYSHQPSESQGPADSITLLTPIVAWVADAPAARLNVFLKYHYPELLSESATIEKGVELNYLKTFPSRKMPRGTCSTLHIHRAINTLRLVINNNSVADEGVAIALNALREIIRQRIK